MRRAVIGGLITSTFLTLLVVPVVYSLFDDFAAWLHRRWARANALEQDAHAAPSAAAARTALGVILLLACLAPTGAAAAEGTRVLTLDQALAIATEKNHDIAKA